MEITQAFALLMKATQKWNYPGYRRLLEIKYKSFSQFLVLKRDLCVSSKSFLGGLGVGAMFAAAGLGDSGGTSMSPFLNATRETIKSFKNACDFSSYCGFAIHSTLGGDKFVFLCTLFCLALAPSHNVVVVKNS